MLIPQDYRLEFLVTHSKEDHIRDWINRLMENLSTDLPTESIKTELSFIVSRYIENLEKPPEAPCYSAPSWKTPPIDPRVYFGQSLAMLIRSSVLLADEVLFEKTVMKDPYSIPEDVFFDIGKALDSGRVGLFEGG